MTDATHKDIKDRIEAGESAKTARETAPLSTRITDKAVEAKDGLTRFAMDHPVATIAGGLFGFGVSQALVSACRTTLTLPKMPTSFQSSTSFIQTFRTPTRFFSLTF